MSENQDIPRKRPRLDEDGEDGLEENQGSEGTTDRVHEDYNYSDSGICVIRVDQTLFKIHRFLLTRDSVVFRDMFEVPTGDKETSKIIQLPDTLEQVTALCWALYAFLKESSNQFLVNADIRRLLNLACITNKYQFIALEEWSTTVLSHHCKAHNRMGKCSFDELCSTLELAARCTSPKFQLAVEEGVLSRLEKDPEVPWTEILPSLELYGRRQFRGMVYYYLLQATERTGTEVQPSTTAVKTTISLTPEQAQWIRNGYWSLAKYLDRRLAEPLPAIGPCASHQTCQLAWADQLKANMDNSSRSRVDTMGRLAKAQRAIGKIKNPRECITRGLAGLEASQKELVDTMADHFFGLLPASV